MNRHTSCLSRFPFHSLPQCARSIFAVAMVTFSSGTSCYYAFAKRIIPCFASSASVRVLVCVFLLCGCSSKIPFSKQSHRFADGGICCTFNVVSLLASGGRGGRDLRRNCAKVGVAAQEEICVASESIRFRFVRRLCLFLLCVICVIIEISD